MPFVPSEAVLNEKNIPVLRRVLAARFRDLDFCLAAFTNRSAEGKQSGVCRPRSIYPALLANIIPRAADIYAFAARVNSKHRDRGKSLFLTH